MQRINISPRNNWQSAVEKLSFHFHSTNVPYWNENAYYKFSLPEIELIENATNELWEMCLQAVEYVIETKQYQLFHVPEYFIPHLEKTWFEDHPSIYGRFDLVLKNGELKMLEFNADTPTSLFEAAIVQWFWLQDFSKESDQFNSIHEKLIDYWSFLKKYLFDDTLHFSCVKKSLEDLTTVEYLRDTAMQAGFDTNFIFVDEIGWDEMEHQFVDEKLKAIKNIFKLYPYEWMANETFGKNILIDKNKCFWIEPSWKMLLSNKALLPILWQLFPEHPLLLPSYFDVKHLKNFVRKPILSREGANIEVFKNNILLDKTLGEYGEEGFVYQQLFELPKFENNYALIGSWIIGQQAAGIGIRESDGLITNNTSRFVPHLIR